MFKYKKSLKRIALFIFCLLLILYLVFFLAIRAPVFGANPKRIEVESIDFEKLKKHVYFLSTLEPTRSVHHPESLEKAARYIIEEFKQMGYQVEKQVVPIDKLKTYNIIVRWVPEGLVVSQKTPWLVVGAHYDSHGKRNPGADDNASGVAGLLELARLFKKHNPIMENPIEFVAFTTEEPPYFAQKQMGSAIHAKQLQKNDRRIRLMYSLEMIGYFSEELFSQSYNLPILSLFYPLQGNFIGLVGGVKEYQILKELKKSFLSIEGLKTYSINAPASLEGVDYSDHRSYWNYGWKAVMVTDTAFLRNKNYHKSGDTADRLNYPKMALVVAGVYNSLLNL